MGKKKAKAPKAPDPRVLIPLQTQANKDMFQYQLDQQRVNSYNPYSDKIWEKVSNFDQAGYDKAMADYNASPLSKIAGASSKFAPNRADFERTPTWNYRETDKLGTADYIKGLAADSLSPQFNQNVGDAVYNSQTRYLDPQIARDKQGLEARLAEQGFVPGTPGYNQAMETFGDTNNRAYGAARDSATLQGYGQANAALARRESIANLMRNGSSSSTRPEYQTPSIQGPDIMGAYNNQYQGQLAQYNADVAQNNGVLGAMTGLAGAALLGPMGGAAAKGISGLFSGGGTAGTLMNGLGSSGGSFWPSTKFGY